MFWRSGGGKRLYDQVRKKYEIIAFTDNDPRKWGKSIFGIPVYSPESCIKMNFDFIVITSAPGLESIKLQLFENNIKEEQIITSYVEQHFFLQSPQRYQINEVFFLDNNN